MPKKDDRYDPSHPRHRELMVRPPLFKVGDRRWSDVFQIELQVVEVWERTVGAGDWQVVLARMDGTQFCREGQDEVLAHTREQRAAPAEGA